MKLGRRVSLLLLGAFLAFPYVAAQVKPTVKPPGKGTSAGSSAKAPSTTPTAVLTRYDGDWAGTTSQGLEITFSVVQGTVTAFSVGGQLQGDGCSTKSTSRTTLGAPIQGSAFQAAVRSGPGGISFTINGNFSGSGADVKAEGQIEMSFQSAPGPPPGIPGVPYVPPCFASAHAGWSAQRGAAKTSNTSAPPPPLASSGPPADREAERSRLIDKAREVNRWGPEHRIVGDMTGEVDKAIATGENVAILLGWGLTGDGQAYRLNWIDNRFSLDKLTPEAAAGAGFTRMNMTVQHKGRSSAPGMPAPPSADNSKAEAKVVMATAEKTAEARALFSKVLGTFGDEARLKNIKSFKEAVSENRKSPQGETSLNVESLVIFPDRVYKKINLPMGEVTMVISPQASFMAAAILGTPDLPNSERDEAMRQIKRGLLFIATHAGDPELKVALGGNEAVGEVNAQVLEINCQGSPVRWFVHPASGRLLATRAQQVTPKGPVESTTEYSNWKAVQGINYPFAARQLLNGQEVGTSQVQDLQLNPPVDPKLFEKPSKPRG